MQRRRLVGLAALFVSAACSAPPAAAPDATGPTATAFTIAGEGTQLQGAVEHVELRVDGSVPSYGSADGYTLNTSPFELQPGDHTIEVRATLSAKVDETGRGAIWSVIERVRVTPGTSRVDVRLVLPNDGRPVARRLEARFRGTGIELLGGSVPSVQPIDTTKEEAIALARMGHGDSIDEAQKRIAQMSETRNLIASGLEEARTAKDIVRVNCQNDKLTQLDVAMRSASERFGALSAASKNGDAAAMVHESTLLVVLSQRADQLLLESRQCVGEEAGIILEDKPR